MKEELIKILNSKLDDINSDIDSLVELNDKITNEDNNLSYITSIIDIFKSNHENNIMSFPKLNKEDFNKILDILGGDVKDAFTSKSCNYDGLVYLINGINEGVSLTLTDEQKNAILYLISKLGEKEEEYQTAIEGYKLVKDRYLISDVDELKVKKENYLTTLDELSKKEYVSDIDLLLEAINFSEIPNEKTIEILKYLLEYNADIYKNHPTYEKTESVKEEEHPNDEEKSSYIEENSYKEPLKDDNSDNLFHYDFLSDNLPHHDEDKNDNQQDLQEETSDLENHEYQEFHFNDIVQDNITDMTSAYDFNFSEIKKTDDENAYIPEIDEKDNNNDVSNNEEVVNTDLSFDNHNYYEDSNEKVSTGDLQILLNKFGIQEETSYLNELVVGDIKSYENILNTLKDNNLIDNFKMNSELLVETLLYSDSDSILKALEIIKNDLSVDEDDYLITTKIVIDTIPSIFINHEGNYSNFIKNVETFKDLELNLINLFDFSKELFVANHDSIMDNLEIVKKYDIKITYQNAKYLLLLPDIGDKLDYYVESIYLDKEKNEVFDGLEYINLYTVKLNVVTSETIKRLRYSSENGKKLFGNKPKSLVGEITNLKVKSLDISDDYLNKFFNNEFAMLTADEVREYTKLIHSSSNVGDYSDELDFLEKFHNGPRYIIDDINISYNKVLRNYSILRSYGIDTKKALHFAVCYNLVITKEEYEKLRSVLDELGGNL